MIKIKDLSPAEAKLLMDIKGTHGDQLLIKTIEELLLMGKLILELREFNGKQLDIVKPGIVDNTALKSFHNTFLKAIEEHYREHPEVNESNYLTPLRLMGRVRSKFDFNDNKFKFSEIYRSLEKQGLVKPKLPFYYFGNPLTKTGEELKSRLQIVIDDFSRIRKRNPEREKLMGLTHELGNNILLIPGLYKYIDYRKRTIRPSSRSSSYTVYEFIADILIHAI